MQDLRSLAGGTRTFGGGGGGGGIERRMRQHPQQALKCPRCDSLNTKFCYYNNYNLSQPRHFCKACRRYWTKGGVLRNVPVGGGCRKTKRSSSTSNSKPKPHPKPSSHSSSDSSSLTGSTVAANPAPAEIVSASATSSAFNYTNSTFDPSPTPPPLMGGFSHGLSDANIFVESGSFTSMMTASNPGEIQGFGFSGVAAAANATLPLQFTPHHHHQKPQQQMGSMLEFGDITAGYIDQTVGDNGGLSALDWRCNGGEQGLFDIGGGDQQSYWTNHCSWPETATHEDHSLYLP